MTAMCPAQSLFQELGRAPIPGSSPVGADPVGSPAFDAVMAEVNKLTQLDGGAVDWMLVVQHAAAILSEQSKDLRIAAYLARGLFEQQGLPGLALGLDILADIVGEYWTECWPGIRRMRGRAAALTWMVEKTAPLVRARFVDCDDAEDLRRILSATCALSERLSETMGEAAPDFSELNGALNAKLRETEPEHRSQAMTAAPSAPRHAVAQSVSPPASLAGMTPPDPTSDRAVKQVFTEVAAALRPDDLGNPLYYHMVRYATWRGIRDIPFVQADGRTQLAPVPSDRVSQYEKMLANRQYADVIGQVEISVARNPFWLGGHRLVEAALRELGHPAACAAVRHEARMFLDRLPGLLDLRFSDGSPFADALTAKWLQDDVLAPPVPKQGLVAGSGGGGGWRDLLAAADTAAPGAPSEALRHLEAGLMAEREPRQRFLWGMALAHACLAQGHLALAETQFSRLSDQYTALGLSAWEPMLGADLRSGLASVRTHAPRAMAAVADVPLPVIPSSTGGNTPVLHQGED